MFNLKPNYVTDSDNNKVAVQLNIETYERVEEVLENYALYKLMGDSDIKPLSLREAKTFYKKLKKKK